MAERSTDAQFLKPAVLALAFGVFFALFVTLFMVPALYVIGEDASQHIESLKSWLREKLGLMPAPRNNEALGAINTGETL